MTLGDIGRAAWQGFWSQLGSPGGLGAVLAVLAAVAGLAFALRGVGGVMLAVTRVLSGVVALLLIYSMLTNLGLPVMAWLQTLISSVWTAIDGPRIL